MNAPAIVPWRLVEGKVEVHDELGRLVVVGEGMRALRDGCGEDLAAAKGKGQRERIGVEMDGTHVREGRWPLKRGRACWGAYTRVGEGRGGLRERRASAREGVMVRERER